MPENKSVLDNFQVVLDWFYLSQPLDLKNVLLYSYIANRQKKGKTPGLLEYWVGASLHSIDIELSLVIN